MNKLLKDLNKEQLEAVKHKTGPLLIIAGAGTGKTTVITKRIAYLISQKLAKPEEILALTFTEKAASEMEERVDVLVPYGFINTHISTFHAFGERLLTEHAFSLGINTDFKVLSTEEQIMFFNEHIFSFDLKYFRPGSNPLKYVRPILTFFSRCKDELITPKEIILYAQKELKKAKTEDEKINAKKYLELGNIYKKYQQLLSDEGFMDFGDQINLVIKLLKNHPDIRSKLHQQFKYILVDEFQDTNYAQNILINLLVGKDQNITVVGDDDQSIYKFRGASISNIMDFTNIYKNTKIIVLNKNYRSTQEILDCAYNLIQNNNPDRLEIKQKISKKLISINHGEIPQLKLFSDHYAEGKFIADDIKSQFKKLKSLKYKDIAIITRSNHNFNHITNALKSEKIPFITSTSVPLFETKSSLICISFIKTLAKPTDDQSIFQLFISDIYNYNIWDLAKINSLARQKNRPLITILENISNYSKELNIDNKIIYKIISTIDEIKRYANLAKTKTVREILYKYLSDKQYLSQIIKNEEEQQNLINLFRKIEEFENITHNKTIYNYINYLDTQIESGTTFDQFENYDIDAVNIITAHSSKGLEFEKVYLSSLTSDYFPTKKRKDPIELPTNLIKETLPEKDYHLEEERRLFYVATTRAKKYLTLTSAQNYGGVRSKKPSHFIEEFLNINIKNQQTIQSTFNDIIINKQAQPNLFNYKKTKTKRLLLNAHKIDDYLTCPYKYYYATELKLPIAKSPTIMYGNAMHKAVEYYLNSKINDQKVSLKDLYDVFDKNWASDGFKSINEENQRKKEGIIALKNFYDNNSYTKSNIDTIERPFKFQFSKNTIINGRYDLVLTDDEKFIIGDFKTSTIDNQKQADTRIKRSRQMMLYALAFYKEFNIFPQKIFLDFIGSKFKAEFKPTQKTIEKISKDIEKTEEGIMKQDFTAKSDKFTCTYCAYKTICPYKYKGA